MSKDTIAMNLHVKKYTSRVLGVIKEKFDLKDKSEAMDKFVELYGEEFIDREVKDEVILEVIKSCEQHTKKYPNRRMSDEELKELCGIE